MVDAKQYTYPKLEDIPVSTKTFIAMTNLELDLKKLYEFLETTEYNIVQKKRGRKKKEIDTEIENNNVPDGSIITMKYENKIKGIDLKPKKNNKKKKSKWFRNSFTVVMILDNKPINFKICKNGVFQITGCKIDKHADGCIKHIWEYIKDEENNIFKYTKGSNMESIFIPAMRNVDFNIGFCIDREKLSRFMTTQTKFNSLLETSFGYTGCNVKIKLSKNIVDLVLRKIVYMNDEYVESTILYGDYLKLLPEKEQLKKLNKVRYSTFLIFQSGKIICSSISKEYSRDAYEYFIEIIKECRPIIEEKLDLF